MNFTKLLRDLLRCGSGILLFVLVLSGSLCAQTEVEGEVSGVWTREGSPYLLSGLIVIPEEDTLSIEPGVEVIIVTHIDRINVFGCLLALGSEEDSIYFSHPNIGWSGIQVYSEDTLRFSYCSYIHDNIELHVDMAALKIDHCNLRYGYIHARQGNDTYIEVNHSNLGNLISRPTGTVRLSNNQLNQWISIYSNTIIMQNYNKGLFRIESPGENIQIINNHFIDYSHIIVYDRGSNIVIANNTLDCRIDLEGRFGVVEAQVINNYIDGGINLEGVTDVLIADNVFRWGAGSAQGNYQLIFRNNL